MTRARLLVASTLLALAAVATPVAATHMVHGQDIGWGADATSTVSETATTETPSSTDTTLGDIGWG